MKALVQAYHALSDIYLKGSWISEAIKKQGAPLLESKGSYRLVYGVVEHEYLYEYRISRLVEKSPKAAVKILLKMGMYLLDESTLPDYAAVNEIADTAKKVGKGGVCAFVNAVLRRYAKEGKTLYPTEPDLLLSVRANLPLWLVKRYQKELGADAEKRLTAPRSVKTHVRPAFSFGKKALYKALSERNATFEKTEYGAYIGEVGAISDLLKEGKATVMSWGSADICSALDNPENLLDLCAAPGGKSVYIAEKFGIKVIACDLYEHRATLIRAYAERMKVKDIQVCVQDGRVLREEWMDAFSAVLLDAPCSGLGSLASNPDIVLNRTEKAFADIINTQKQLLSVACRYVKKGGVLLYATCSDLPSENADLVREFLQAHAEFTLEKQRYTDPEAGGGESYYYARMRKQ